MAGIVRQHTKARGAARLQVPAPPVAIAARQEMGRVDRIDQAQAYVCFVRVLFYFVLLALLSTFGLLFVCCCFVEFIPFVLLVISTRTRPPWIYATSSGT